MYKFNKKSDPPQEVLDELKDKVQILEALLEGRSFLAGGDKPTIADISLGVNTITLAQADPSLVTPKIQAWYDRVGAVIPQLPDYNNQAMEAFKQRMNS